MTFGRRLGEDILVGCEALAGLTAYSLRRKKQAALSPLLQPGPGRQALTADERRRALKADSGLQRLGVRCLARAVVVGRMLRRRGVDARVAISVRSGAPADAHAEVVVGDTRLRPLPAGGVVLR